MQLAKKVYFLVRSFPEEEKYGLSDQIRRAVVSIPSNIAEGYGRMSDKEFIRFLTIANGSLYELESQLILTKSIFPQIAKDCDTVLPDIDELKKLILSLISHIRMRIN